MRRITASGAAVLVVILTLAASEAVIQSGYAGWNDDPTTQYHIQTDEGPERYFRYQTQSGQYRKEKRLEDGTVIGTYGWVDPTGMLLLRDYVADNAGYRIVRTKKVFVGLEGDAKTSTPVVSQPKLPVVQVVPTPTPTPNPVVVIAPKQPIQTNYLYDHPESASKPQAANFGSHPYYTRDFGEYEPVVGYQRKKTGYFVKPSVYKQPTPSNVYAQPTPSTVFVQPNPTYSQPASNSLEYGVRKQPTYAPIRVYTPEQQDFVLRNQASQASSEYKYRQQAADSSYDGISTTQNGFKYFLPKNYHEEEGTATNDRTGSYGYIDPFGIRRVVYYNSSPGSGFQVKKNNRYVGFDSTPYDPRP
ncbi:uncharacterized protein LOC132198455 [Neocloeon triangulifer]|uniref:uncharacterized protein LOC132198455 n=1 Tax=Neocloeon triangulifer TaxID=2078957 RepID=UPI00286EE5BF|nr:uncharacterized protein LOC132198455 [Neocloeon triangulifer]